MNKQISILIAAAIAVALFAGTATAGSRDTNYRNVKSIGMGDTRVMNGFSYNGFIDNPALLSRVKYLRVDIIPVPFMFNENLWTIAKFISDNQDNFQNFDNLDPAERDQFLNDVQKHDGKWSRIGVSPLVSVALNIKNYGVGVAVYNNNNVNFKIDRGIYEPLVWGEGFANYVGVVGVSRPLTFLYPGLTVGANFKYMQRRSASLFQISASDLGSIDDTIQPVLDDFKESEHNTMAMDIGAMLDIPLIDTEVGAVMQSLGDGRGAHLNLGASKRFLNDHVIVLADYLDFLDNNRENMFNKIHFGAEWHFLFLALRGGFNSGYPTLGAGLDFRIMDLDVAWYKDELGNAPGMYEDQRYAVQMKLGW